MKKQLSFVLLLLQSFGWSWSQDIAPTLPPSPNAASLAIYADYPVSHYTGIPGINIPLYQIEVDGLNIPISLSYHASGIKVSQEASWVGLGWTLIGAGGAVSRTVKCYDDFLEYLHPTVEVTEGYYHDPDITDPLSTHYYTNYALPGEELSIHQRLTIDTEPDIFFYSLPGSSGKFIIDKARGAVLFDKASNVRIEIVHDNTISFTWNKNLCFRITDVDGTQYYYKQREISMNYAGMGSLNENSTNSNAQLDDEVSDYDNLPETYTSSWYLDKITTVHNREISFLYEEEGYRSPTYESCRKYNYVSSSADFPCGPGTVYPTYSRSKTIQTNLRLKQIIWDGGTIVFSASSREDMIAPVGVASPKKLEAIHIFDKNDVLVKKIEFNYSYFNGGQGGNYQYLYKRLKLDNIVQDSDPRNKHIFRYFDDALPAKNSNNVDFWGSYNGGTYGANYYPAIYDMGTLYPGANKLGVFDYMKIGTLNEILYPTGGSTLFTYQPNNLPLSALNVPIVNSPVDLTVFNKYQTIGEHVGILSTRSYYFTVSGTARFSVTKYIENMVCPQRDPDFEYNNSSFLIGRLKRLSPSETVIWSAKMPLVNGGESYCEYVEAEQGFFPTVLTEGFYVFEALTPPKDVYINWKLKLIQTSAGSSVVTGGGLRIAAIKTGNKTRSFTYPTGAMLISPKFAYGNVTTCYQAPEIATVTTLVQNSNSLVPLFSLRNGNAIGYDWVEEAVGGAGKTRYVFNNEPEDAFTGGYASIYNPFMPIEPSFTNGLTEHVDFFSDNGTLLKTINYEYETRYAQPIKAFYYNEGSNVAFPYSYQMNWLLKKTEETISKSDQATFNNSSVFKKQFSYNSNFQLSSEKALTDNLLVEKRFFYSSDFTDNISQQMSARHMIAIPLETINLNDNKVISGEKRTFKSESGLFVPGAAYTLHTSVPMALTTYANNYIQVETYDLFSQAGKLLQMTKKGGQVISYLWGYNSLYPLAEITNASYAQVVAAIGGSAVVDQFNENAPSDAFVHAKMVALRAALPGARIVSFTYLPLIGMKTRTESNGRSAYFNYDAYNRLELVKDNEGNVVKKLSYRYAGPEYYNDLPPVYAKISKENVMQGLWGDQGHITTDADIVIRFYSDQACTTPVEVFELPVKIRTVTSTASGITSTVRSIVCTGDSFDFGNLPLSLTASDGSIPPDGFSFASWFEFVNPVGFHVVN